MPRIDPLPESEWDDELRPILELKAGAAGGRLGDNNIFPTLARHKELLQAWLPFGGYLLGGASALPLRERELLILRTGYNCGSAYEWGQHVRIAEALGMSREEISRVAAGPDAPEWSAGDRALLRAADELHADARIGDETWAALREVWDERALIEICVLVGQYHLVAFALNSLGVELDEGLEGLPE